jgi:apolipoprotein N-acyltransferase
MLAILPRLLAALLSGALLILVSPPIGWDWLHWFCFLPLYWALRPGPAKTNA